MRGVTIVKSFRLVKKDRFQLTRLMRGVTVEVWLLGNNINDFNSHASCEA